MGLCICLGFKVEVCKIVVCWVVILFLIINGIFFVFLIVLGYWWVYFVFWFLFMVMWNVLIICICNIGEYVVVLDDDDFLCYVCIIKIGFFEGFFIVFYWVNYYCEYYMFMYVFCYWLVDVYCLFECKGMISCMEVSLGYLDVLC